MESMESMESIEQNGLALGTTASEAPAQSSIDKRRRRPAARKGNRAPQERIVLPITHKGTSSHQILQTGTWWALGPHLLYCGDPCSAPFRDRLPKRVSVFISFPADPLDTVPPPTDAASVISFSSIYQDIDFATFREAVERFLLICTSADDEIAIAYLPDSPLILLIDKLECRALIAEPDLKKCQEIMTIWTQIKGETVKPVI